VIRSILAAVDSSPRAPGVLAAALEVGRRFGSRVHVYRAVYVPPDIPAAGHSDDDRGAGRMQSQADRDLRTLVGDAPDVVLEPVEMSETPPWKAILSVAERLDVDLIVIGSHGYGGLDRVLGTNAARVVNLGDRSVLVVHARGRFPGAPGDT
jgi:nucleotide-binding universal stress UspA family protein